jgi:hypothetical protein
MLTAEEQQTVNPQSSQFGRAEGLLERDPTDAAVA